ncbi:phospholipid-transporting ATPase ABCA3-like isoform X2 [Dermacentor albipictus]|uniref:phospholipid-transporting ATPase ABCA3-like isoform X2 n=1 Tax=Dermacentor albipictus TaxID=60249 RepID=UPI0038FC0661
MLSNVKTFLWRTLCVQSRRSRATRMVGAIILTAVLFFLVTYSHKRPTPLSKESDTVNVSSAFTPPQVMYIVYAPKSDYNDELMRAVADEIVSRLKATEARNDKSNGARKPSFARLEGNSDSADTWIDGDALAANEDKPESVVPIKTPELLALKDAEAVINKCTKLQNEANGKDSTKQSNTTTGILCLTASGPSDESPSFALTLYTPVRAMILQPMYFPLGFSISAGQSFDQSVVYQQIIQQEHLKLQSRKYPDAEMNYEVITGAMPGWVFKDHAVPYETILSLAITLAFYSFMVGQISKIKEENENGTSEQQCVMGLSDAEFFWGHFLTALVNGLVLCFVAIAVMLLAGNKDHRYGDGMDLSLVTVSFLIFLIGDCLLIIFFTWVFPKEGASWSLVTRRVLDKDNVTIGELWGVMLICDVFMMFLAWYLSNVLPWSTANRQSPIFCLLPGYWRNAPAVAVAENVNVKQDVNRFEELQPDDEVIITTNNLTKVFGPKAVLNGLNLKVRASKITVLLGHNGAGKTTLMNVLTGMQAPTSGTATVCGYNVASQRYQVRQRVSYCQQTDIFFEDMTCAENLFYFGSLKRRKAEMLVKSIQETLRMVELEDKASSLPKALSGGMKRKLSIAMTIVSEPELLILDEPTAGIDPEARRAVWDTLTTVAKERTLLLSSHDMEEADAIADQIIILASGGVVCSGSTPFLKKACGVGYKLTLSKVKNAFKLHDVMHIVRKTTRAAVVDDEKQEEVSVALGTLDIKGFPAMFRTLESSLEKLGIAGIGVTVASMKDVYLKINLDWAPGGKSREQAVEGEDIDAACKPITKRRTMARSFFALSVKRLLSLLRSWDAYLFFFLVPLAILGLNTWKTAVAAKKRVHSDNKTFDIPVQLGVHFPRSHVVVGESPATDVSRNLQTLVEAQGCTVHSTNDADKVLRRYIHEDFPTFITRYPLAVAFESNDIRMVPNPTSAMTLPIAVNLVYTAWLRVLTAQPAAQINVTISFMETSDRPFFRRVITSRIISWMFWVFGPSLTYTWGFAVYCIFPLTERLSGARDVQLMTGLSGFDYIFAHFVFDFIYHVLFSVSWCAIHYSLSSYLLDTAGHFLLGFLSAGPLFIGAGYLVAEFKDSVSRAAVWFALGFYFAGAASSLLANVLVLLLGPYVPHYVALIFPPYAVHSMLLKIRNSADTTEQCKLLEQDNVVEAGHFLGIDCSGSLLELTLNGIGLELTAILSQGLLFLALMTYLMSGYLPSDRTSASAELAAEEDVEEEKKKVIAARKQDGLAGYSLLAWNLQKWFDTLHAVRGIYMALRTSECFGLLGVNGAGKTTTFQMLAALISVSDGDAITSVATLSGNVRQWQSQISYCVQVGGLLDKMNAYEYLYLVGRLRGIPENELKPMVDSILSVVDLTEHASKECGVYSGGNRRKLSIAAALLGLQPFVFLDEPYAGVDVVSRNKIFRAVAEIKKRSRTTFMLTSHNMDECEFSCDRLTIMVNGQMMCLGTLQHLREKFGQGYRLELFLKPTVAVDELKLKQAVEKQFPGIRLKDTQKNVLSYHLMERIPWSVLFTKVAHLQKNFPLEDALVGENTLQDIFLNFAKAQEVLPVPSGAVGVDVSSASSTKSPATLSTATTPTT